MLIFEQFLKNFLVYLEEKSPNNLSHKVSSQNFPRSKARWWRFSWYARRCFPAQTCAQHWRSSAAEDGNLARHLLLTTTIGMIFWICWHKSAIALFLRFGIWLPLLVLGFDCRNARKCVEWKSKMEKICKKQIQARNRIFWKIPGWINVLARTIKIAH